MVEYIKDYVSWILIAAKNVPGTTPAFPVPDPRRIHDPNKAVSELVQVLNAIDPRDLEPSAQAEFLRVRTNVVWLARVGNITVQAAPEILNSVVAVLDHYRGPGSGGVTRTFPFLADADLREIVERDYAELVVKLYPSGAWKSCVIMAGSILEAILFDRLAHPAREQTALASPKATTRSGSRPPMEKWTLEMLIDVAVDIGDLPRDPADTIHRVLRDYRNFVHPKKEIRAAHACTEAEAMLSVGALDSVCNYLEAHP